ncbi:MAG: hypothetical protein AVDCRST_MAG77-3086, partial [uncultured Chloroflexi bacterium]
VLVGVRVWHGWHDVATLVPRHFNQEAQDYLAV